MGGRRLDGGDPPYLKVYLSGQLAVIVAPGAGLDVAIRPATTIALVDSAMQVGELADKAAGISVDNVGGHMIRT